MSEAEMIGGIAACMQPRPGRVLEPTHDWRKAKRSNPDDTTGANAARARAEATVTPTEPTPR